MGTSFPTWGPGHSACIRYRAFPVDGRMAMASTNTPMPPTQWVKLRQNRMPRGSASTSVKMDEPVVVNPEMLSNSAST